jgi:hypothetical protein
MERQFLANRASFVSADFEEHHGILVLGQGRQPAHTLAVCRALFRMRPHIVRSATGLWARGLEQAGKIFTRMPNGEGYRNADKELS